MAHLNDVDDSVLLLVIAQVPAMFSVLMPSFSEVRTTTDKQGVLDVREAELLAAGVSFTIGTVATLTTKSIVPVVAASVMIGLMVGIYEYGLAKAHDLDPRTPSYNAEVPSKEDVDVIMVSSVYPDTEPGTSGEYGVVTT